jgi:hypothetical protein
MHRPVKNSAAFVSGSDFSTEMRNAWSCTITPPYVFHGQQYLSILYVFDDGLYSSDYISGVTTTWLASHIRLAQDTFNNVRVWETKHFIWFSSTNTNTSSHSVLNPLFSSWWHSKDTCRKNKITRGCCLVKCCSRSWSGWPPLLYSIER